MRKGEEAIVTVQRNSLLCYEIELVDFIEALPDSFSRRFKFLNIRITRQTETILQEKPFWRMTVNDKLEACERRKAEGNSLFEEGDFICASRKYEKVTDYHNDRSYAQSELTMTIQCYMFAGGEMH